MPGITITFGKKTVDHINKIYRQINKKFGKKVIDIHKDLKPHVSLMRTKFKEDEVKIIKDKINVVSKKNKKYVTRAEGISTFSKGKNILMFFSLAYDVNMQKIHKDIWNNLEKKIVPYQKELYHYNAFVPHITIPIINKTKTNSIRILRELFNYDLRFPLEVESITYLQAKIGDYRVWASSKLK